MPNESSLDWLEQCVAKAKFYTKKIAKKLAKQN